MKIKSFILLIALMIMAIAIIPELAYAQAIYEGQVIDKLTELPIPATTVTLSKNISTLANDQGYFKLLADSVAANEVLVFTSVGYQPYKLPIKDYTSYAYIKMQPTITRLNQVNIKAGKQKQVTLDKFLVSNINLYKINPTGIMINNSRWIAKLFNTPTENARLISVQLGRKDYGNYFITTNKFARFILYIMDVDSVTGDPGKALFTREITLQDNSHVVSIDLSKDKLTMPSSRFFVAIEHLFIPYNEVVSIGTSQKVAGMDKKGKQVLEDTPLYFIDYQPFLASYPQNHPITFWYKDKGISWVSHTIPGYINTIALSANIIY